MIVCVILFGGCALTHFFPPSVNNTLNQTKWSTMAFVGGGVTSGDYYSIAVDGNDRIFAGVYHDGAQVFSMLSAAGIDEQWKTNISGGAPGLASLKVAYANVWGMTYALQIASLVQIVREITNAWMNFSATFNSTGLWDYYFDNSGVLFALAQTNSTGFFVAFNSTPAGGSSWATFQSFNKDTGDSTIDLTFALDQNGNVFVGAAYFTNSRTYFNGTSGQCIYNPNPDGMEYSKVVSPGNGKVYVIFKGKDNTIKAAVWQYIYPGMSLIKVIEVYDKAFFVDGSSHELGLSVVADKNSSRIYVGFLTIEGWFPKIIKIENDNILPMPDFPLILSNSKCIKLAVNKDGKPAAAILASDNTLNIYKAW